MVLSTALVILLLTCTGLALPVASIGSRSGCFRRVPFETAFAYLSIATLYVFLCLHSNDFGTDGPAYLRVLQAYCEKQYNLFNLKSSWYFDLSILYFATFGTCSAAIFPLAWATVVLAVLLAIDAKWTDKAYFISALLLSIVGIECLTNALRQGISTALLILSVSYYPRRKWVCLTAGVACIFAHESAVLMLAALCLCMLPIRLYVISMSVLIVWVLTSLSSNVELASLQQVPGIGSFFYELSKYMSHDPVEFWVRALALTTVLSTCATALVVTFVAKGAGSQRDSQNVKQLLSLKLALCCIPLSFVPYFGYRFAYGIYPLILWFSLFSVPMHKRRTAYAMIVGANIVVLFLWALGSSRMSSQLFFSI